eukprot:m.96766 g.96766  ORF g.96766 m.96766 type:complete len:55 (-) comp8973_c0_seq1:130-294(-)
MFVRIATLCSVHSVQYQIMMNEGSGIFVLVVNNIVHKVPAIIRHQSMPPPFISA